jgi:3-oxoacyl-[acyl-carrier protein] reductase
VICRQVGHAFADQRRVPQGAGAQYAIDAVAPGPVATDLFLQGKSEEQIQTFAKMAPLERLAQPEDIARVVSFLVGPDSAWVNGQILRINGGLV